MVVNMPSLYMLVGVPGSGKSTWLNHQFERGFFHDDTHKVISTDNIIEHQAKALGKTYDDVFQDTIKEAQKMADERARKYFEQGFHVIWDQTNTTIKTRAKKLRMVPEGYAKFAVWFDTPEIAELSRRLKNRPGKTIPDHIVSNMMIGLEPPTLNEGFANVLYVASNYGDYLK
jgi:predicted kinase